MAKSRKHSANRLPPFVPLIWEVLNAPAFIALCHYARAVLPYCLGKVKVPYNDARRLELPFSFPYSEAKKLGFPTSTFAKAIQQLVEHGFIDPVRKGGCYGDLKVSNQFKLSNRWQKYGTPSFIQDDWKSFIQKPRKNKAPLSGGKCIAPAGEKGPDTS